MKKLQNDTAQKRKNGTPKSWLYENSSNIKFEFLHIRVCEQSQYPPGWTEFD